MVIPSWVKQLLEKYEVKNDDLMLYHKYALQLLNKLETIKLEYVPRSANKIDDAFVNLATTLALRAEENINVLMCKQLGCGTPL